MTTTIRATGTADFLGLVPHLLNCTPTESLVLVPFNGFHTVGAMRVDLPTITEQHAQAAHMLAGLLCRVPDADGLVAVIYDTHPHAAHDTLTTELRKQAHACGLSVLDTLYVTDDGYGRIGQEPQPLTDLAPVTVDGVAANTGDQHSHSRLPSPEPELMDAALSSDISDVLIDRDRFVQFVERIAAGEEVDPEMFAVGIFTAERPSLRDIMLVGVVRGTEAARRAWDAQEAWENGAEYPADLAAMMWGEGPRPDAARLQNLDALLRRIAASEEDVCPGSLATLAWVAWALGRSTVAMNFTQASQKIDPGHGLAGIVATMVSASHLPAWAFDRQ